MSNLEGGRKFNIALSSDLKSDDDVGTWQWRLGPLPPLPPPESDVLTGDKVWIKMLTVKEEGVHLSYERQPINRVLSADPPDKFVLASFGGFKFKEESPKVTSAYIERMLGAGITLNGIKYRFYGHSNSQLKSKSCYLLALPSAEMIMKKINDFGNFSNFSSVAKRAKRIGLLFSAAESTVKLDPKFTRDIDDVEENGHTFTDGCGMINKWFAMDLAKKRGVIFHDTKYCPSAFQIRYKGYKGMLMVNLNLPMEEKVHFRRDSMKKFKDCPDNTFAVLNYSKPFTFGYLNGEIVTLLSALGIGNGVFLKKQNEYFEFLRRVASGASLSDGFYYLCYKGETDLGENILVQGITPRLLQKMKTLVKDEWSGFFKKKPGGEKVERVRILVPESRMLFGLCDYTGLLKEGECFIRITHETGGARTLDGAEVIVTRNPCLHPGDIRKFRAVTVEGNVLNHIVDCIVFPIVGKRDAASLMSGGDLDGDQFFVCWDRELIPQKLFEPYGYPPAREVPTRDIKYEDMIKYFAQWNNASLGKVKNLYLKWAKAKNDAGSKECQELNKLFSSCVDGEGVKIPEHLETPPEPGEPWILDLLVDNIKEKGLNIFQQDSVEAFQDTPPTEEQLVEILSSKHLCLRDEFELFQMVLRLCTLSKRDIDEFICYFDFGQFTSVQKHIVLNNLHENYMLREQYLGPIFNGLYQSQLLTRWELEQANLDDSRVRWQLFYGSEYDDGRRLYNNLAAVLAHFDKKLIVARVDDELTIAMYLPLRIEIDQQVDVGGGQSRPRQTLAHVRKYPTVKLFAWDPTTGHFYKKTTVRGFKLNFDGEILQLFEKQIRNTFIWFALNEKYQVRNGMRNNGKIPEAGHYKFSIALQKFDQTLLRNHKRVTKQVNSKLEIYVISNRDRVGQDLLDISMNQVDTMEVKKILENIPKDYQLSEEGAREEEVDLAICKIHINSGKGFELLKDFCELDQVVRIILHLHANKEGKLIRVFQEIVHHANLINMVLSEENFELMQACLRAVPSISFSIIKALNVDEANNNDAADLLSPSKSKYLSTILLKSLLRSVNQEGETCRKNFSKLFDWILKKQVKFGIPLLIDLVKMILFSVRVSSIAEKLIRIVFDEKHHEIFSAEEGLEEGRLSVPELDYALHYIQALGMDSLSEIGENCPCDSWGVPIGGEDFGNEKKISSPSERNNYKLSNFLPGFDEGDKDKEPIPWKSTPPEPAQINVEIKHLVDCPGVYVTILRTDIICSIRNEDHVRFCASKKATNAPRRGRVTVFDAIVKTIGSGKMEFVIVQGYEPAELFLASWNIYISFSTTNLTTQLSAIMTLLERRGEATSAYYDILEIELPNSACDGDRGRRFWREELQPHKELEFGRDTHFNASQERAVRESVGGPVTLVWGPPGTGKTSVVVEVLLQLLQVYSHLRVLVTASTHVAVDNVMERFLQERRKLLGEGHKDTESDDSIRLTSDISKVKPSLKRWTLDAFIGKDLQGGVNDKAKGKAMKKWKEGRIVFTTCSGAGVGYLRERNSHKTALSIKGLMDNEDAPLPPSSTKAKNRKILNALQKFDVVIVDEASQITEPNALIPIVKSSNMVILVGDHVQLSPTVKGGEEMKEFRLNKSLFEKLYTCSTSRNLTKVMLDMQYRMHPTLALFPSEAFYGGKLKSGVTVGSRLMPGSDFPWPEVEGQEGRFPCVFVPCASPESYCKGGESSKMNRGQIDVTLKIVKQLRSEDVKDKGGSGKPLGIAVLTPYAKQKVETIKALKSLGAGGSGIEVNTIDGFQGREEDIIIFCTVRNNRRKELGFTGDSKRINVAITRARFGLIIVGDEETLQSNAETKRMISEPFCKKVDINMADVRIKMKKKK